MSFVHGKATSVYLGAVDLSPYLTSMDLAADADTAETTTFHATWKSLVTGALSLKVDYAGLYDPTELQLGTFINPGVLTYCPGGASAVGDRARLVNALEVAYAQSSPVGGVVSVKGSFGTDSQVGFGDVLHPLAKDTNTTTGTGKDDGGATTTGWTAHLHVTLVDAGSWVVRLQDSANNSTWADVTSGAFTAATTATSQRLTGAAGATLRQYVRYIATRTGGTTGDGLTFALAYARSS